MARGLETASWPGRLQQLTRGPLVEGLPTGWELWLDGGHNPAAGAALAESLQTWRERPLHLIYGMLDTEAAAAQASTAGFKDVAAADSVMAALKSIVEGAGGPSRILICGSLYLAGHVLSENG